MSIEKTQEGSAVMLSLSGSLDALTAPELEKEVSALEEEITDLVLDFQGVEYLSSAGLRQIVRAQKRMKNRGNFMLVRVREDVMDVFLMTGLSERLNILS